LVIIPEMLTNTKYGLGGDSKIGPVPFYPSVPFPPPALKSYASMNKDASTTQCAAIAGHRLFKVATTVAKMIPITNV